MGIECRRRCFVAPERDRRFSLDELSTLAGVTARTVRYYIAEGLLEPPAGAQRGVYHLQRHLERLLLVRRWTEAGLSLDRIRELITGGLTGFELRSKPRSANCSKLASNSRRCGCFCPTGRSPARKDNVGS